MSKETELEVPINEKLILTLKEAVAYSNIGVNRLSNMIDQPGCPFALFVGRKKLVKREVFDEYINSDSIHFL